MMILFCYQIVFLLFTFGKTAAHPPDPKPENRKSVDVFSLGCPADKHKYCSGWAKEGHCKGEYASYMQETCRKSCGLPCKKKKKIPTTASTTKKLCPDIKANCAGYKRDYKCDGQYEDWMKINCKATCGYPCEKKATTAPKPKKKATTAPTPKTKATTAPKPKCKDKDSNCASWAKQGFCTKKYVDHMKKNCQKSCGFSCGKCTDKNTDCEAWSKNGVCKNNIYEEFMKKNCQKSCNFPCGTVTEPPQDTCGKSPVQWSPKFVVNGVAAKKGAWPWIVSLQQGGPTSRSHRHFCGGTLVRKGWVLTAAHCVGGIIKSGVWRWSVKLGAHDHRIDDKYVQWIGIRRVIKHPRYNSRLLADMALLKLTRKAKLNKRVTLGCMPKKGVYPDLGKNCIVAGWGMTRYPGGGTASILQQTVLPVVQSRKCKHQLEVVCVGLGYKIGKQHPNACRGDSGGPLVCPLGNGRWSFEGVASYVYTYCKYYTGYSPVNKYLGWVNSMIKKYGE